MTRSPRRPTHIFSNRRLLARVTSNSMPRTFPISRPPRISPQRCSTFSAPRRKVMNDTERYAQGMKVRRAVLGGQHVDKAVANSTPFNEPFQDLITRYAWGE